LHTFLIDDAYAIIWPPGTDKSRGGYIDDVFLEPTRDSVSSLQEDLHVPAGGGEPVNDVPFPVMRGAELRRFRLEADDRTQTYRFEVQGSGDYILDYCDFITFRNCWRRDDDALGGDGRIYSRGGATMSLSVLGDRTNRPGTTAYEITYMPR
jgi:hypothetical protein